MRPNMPLAGAGSKMNRKSGKGPGVLSPLNASPKKRPLPSVVRKAPSLPSDQQSVLLTVFTRACSARDPSVEAAKLRQQVAKLQHELATEKMRSKYHENAAARAQAAEIKMRSEAKEAEQKAKDNEMAMRDAVKSRDAAVKAKAVAEATAEAAEKGKGKAEAQNAQKQTVAAAPKKPSLEELELMVKKAKYERRKEEYRAKLKAKRLSEESATTQCVLTSMKNALAGKIACLGQQFEGAKLSNNPANLPAEARKILDKATTTSASTSTSTTDATKDTDKPRIAREVVYRFLEDLEHFNQDLGGQFDFLTQCMKHLGKTMPDKSLQERIESEEFTEAFCIFIGEASKPHVTNGDRWDALSDGVQGLVDRTAAVLSGKAGLFSEQLSDESVTRLRSLYMHALEIACMSHGLRIREQHPGRMQNASELDGLPSIHNPALHKRAA
ncbi:MAG: hypothetical protein M1831_003040 [Alyxoria varia]|nr:MAG: hypothetical protein M1831_003040 [Alyxoria varia]